MATFEVHVNEESIRRGARNITGTCFIKLGDTAFPEAGWSDFVVIVLGWWLRAFDSVAKGEKAELSFMDGPFLVRIEPVVGDHVHIVLLEERASGDIHHGDARVSLSQANESCVRASSRVLDVCRERRWLDDDLQELAALVGAGGAV